MGTVEVDKRTYSAALACWRTMWDALGDYPEAQKIIENTPGIGQHIMAQDRLLQAAKACATKTILHPDLAASLAELTMAIGDHAEACEEGPTTLQEEPNDG